MDLDRSSALEHLMREARDLQRRLTEAVSSGVGLGGIAQVLSDITGRPAAIWGACNTAPVCFPPETRPPMRPTAHNASSWNERRTKWIVNSARPVRSVIATNCDDSNESFAKTPVTSQGWK